MLSILIPSRNEKYLQQTIDDVFKHAKGKIEVLVGLDGWNDDFIISDHPGIDWVIKNKSIGQRAMTNELAKRARGKYLMKIDAHCSLSPGYDIEMLKDMDKDTVLVPTLAKLDVRNWQVLSQPICSNFYIDTNLEFRYGENKPELVHEVMGIQGSGFMCSKEKYFELNLCDESLGSWGMQGTEVALKTWLSGGRVLSTKNAFMGHWFRMPEEGGSGFPYERDMEQVRQAFSTIKDMFYNNKWSKQTRSLQWLVEYFNYPIDWTPKKVNEFCKINKNMV